MTDPLPNHHPRLPADRFYWAVLTPDVPASSLRSLNAPMTRAILDEAFASHLPVDLGSIAPAYTRLPDNSVLACALPASALDESALAAAITLAPSELPRWLDHDADPERLNVLTGAYEPRPVTAARRSRSMAVACTAALVALGLIVGFERRATSAREDHNAAMAEIDRLASSKSAVEIGLSTSQPMLERSFALERELSRLRATRSTSASLGLGDATDPLATLLAAWPRGVNAQVQTLTAAPKQLTMSALLPTLPDAERLAASLGTAPGWDHAQPQITTTGKGVQMQLTLTPAPTSPNSKPQGGTP
jgi:hypothetical protein